MNEYRVIASRVTNYVAYIGKEDDKKQNYLLLMVTQIEQFLDDDDYEVYEIEEAD